MILSIVVPCYNDQEVLPITFNALQYCLDDLIVTNNIDDYEIVFVNDGSLDNTYAVLKGLASKYRKVKVISFYSNCGHQSAILCGILNSMGDAIVTMDSDLQDPPNEIVNFLNEYKKGNEIVFGIRNNRDVDPFLKRLMAEGFYRIARVLGVPGHVNAADYRLISNRVRDNLSEYQESNLYLRGLIASMNFPASRVYYKRMKRVAGSSGYTFIKSMGLAVDGITAFSIKPLRIIGTLGVMLMLMSVLLIAWAIYERLFVGSPLWGWTSLFSMILFLNAINFIFLSVVGEYVGKTYMEIKRRPRYIIEKKINF